MKYDDSDVRRLTKEYPEESLKAREAKLTEALLLLEREIVERTPRGAGPIHLADTIHSDASAKGQRVSGIVGTPAQYGEPVEFGTRPHWPPKGPVQHWVERVLGITGREAASVAFLICRAIAKRGTKGAHMFETGWMDAESRVMSILDEIPEEIIRRLGK